MTDDELTALERLANDATPGPWEVVDYCYDPRNGRARVLGVPSHGARPILSDGAWKTDCHFIAASRTAVPALIAEVRRLRDVLRRVLNTTIRHDGSTEIRGFLCDELPEVLRAEAEEAGGGK